MATRVLTISNLGYLLLGLATAAAVWLGLTLWLEQEQRFPFIEAGVYSGEISSRGASPATAWRPFLIARHGASAELDFTFLDERLEIQHLVLAPLPSRSGVAFPEAAALQVNSPNDALSLSGARTAERQYSGKIKELSSGVEAEWRLKPLDQAAQQISDRQAKDLKLWLALRAELVTLETRLAFLQQQVPKQAEEINKLEVFVTEGVGLKQRADQKFMQVRGLVKAALDRLKLKQQEAKELEGKISLSQKVTPMGRLVSLGRESLTREANWVENMLKLNPQRGDTERLNSDYIKARRISELKRAIEIERDRIEGQNQGAEYNDSYAEPEQ